MDTEGRIDRLLIRLEAKGMRTAAIVLYAEGVKTKLKQVRLSLTHLRRLEHLDDTIDVQDSATIPPEQVSVNKQVIFYCDCFWDFLRSSLDIMGQLINQVCSLHLDERDVDLKRVAAKVKGNPGSPLDKVLDMCLGSKVFKNLEEYRHCSTHRRPIYVETKTTTISVSGTPGYYSGSSSPITIIGRYLYKNPWDLTPHVDDSRPVAQYCESLLRGTEKHIDRIVNCLS